jgi:hypothetical protein
LALGADVATAITEEIIDGKSYYTVTSRGTVYCAYFVESEGEWFVSTRRLALGKSNAGGGKYYANIEDCKPFAGLLALI